MLSDEEKREMLQDATSDVRRQNFRAIKEKDKQLMPFDDYLLFLDTIQKIFLPFKISHHITHAKFNKL